MTKGKLRLPGGIESVDVVYKAPRMICTSQHAIKQYADRYAKRIQHRSIAATAFSVFLTTLPIVTTEQKFSDAGWISGESLPGLFLFLTWTSFAFLILFGLLAIWEWRKANSDYLIQELLDDGDSSTSASETRTTGTTIPLRDFSSRPHR